MATNIISVIIQGIGRFGSMFIPTEKERNYRQYIQENVLTGRLLDPKLPSVLTLTASAKQDGMSEYSIKRVQIEAFRKLINCGAQDRFELNQWIDEIKALGLENKVADILPSAVNDVGLKEYMVKWEREHGVGHNMTGYENWGQRKK